MATYPTLPMSVDSKRIPRDGREEEFSTSGKVYVRRLQSADRYDFDIRHLALTSTQMTTLNSFYATNANLAVDLVWPEDGVTYTGLRFGKNGYKTEPSESVPNCRNATVRLVGST